MTPPPRREAERLNEEGLSLPRGAPPTRDERFNLGSSGAPPTRDERFNLGSSGSPPTRDDPVSYTHLTLPTIYSV